MGAFEQYGETEATIPELEELQNARERLTAPYSASYAFAQDPRVSTAGFSAILNLLVKTIEQARAATEAARSVREIKSNGTYHDSATKNSCSTDKKAGS